MTKRSRFLVVGVLVAAALAPAPADAASPTRYSLAGGCYSVRFQSTGRYLARTADGYDATARTLSAAEGFRMKATALGRYLLYGRKKTFLAVDSDGKVTAATTPSRLADWKVVAAGKGLFRLQPVSAPGKSMTARVFIGGGSVGGALIGFKAAGRCASFPEVGLGAKGQAFKGASATSDVKGFLDAHMHWMAFEFIGGHFHCGRPWSPYGVEVALPDCADREGPSGSASPLQNTLNYGSPTYPHDTKGWPTFKDWPSYHTLTYEVTYYRWIQRAWLAGLRVMVVPLVSNRALCDTYPDKVNSCDEMDTTRLEAKDAYALQDYVDAQAGGPGKGFVRIVKDPFQARRVINQGKMALVLGIENSELFGCSGSDQDPHCDKAKIDSGLNEMHKLGIRSIFLVNKFDNALSGVRFDGGPIGAVINGGNQTSAGHFWKAETCKTKEHDNTIASNAPLIPSSLGDLNPGALPVYPKPPHCNTLGLSKLGDYLIRRMAQKGMVVETDHVSAKSGNQMLALLKKLKYSGVISAHSWIDPLTYPRVYSLGGIVTPYAGSSVGFASAWKKDRAARDKRFLFGSGWGSDVNGLGAQGPPRPADEAAPVKYPFKSVDGKVTFSRQKSGVHTYDINKDGVAHYGLYPDWVEDLRKLAGQKIINDLNNGAEAYLEMWERAVGVRRPGCLPAHQRVSAKGYGDVRAGLDVRTLLLSAGQPASRPGNAFRYCIRGGGSVVATFSPRGRVARVIVGRHN